MGTDSVKLFNKALADQILAMEQALLVHFLEEKSFSADDGKSWEVNWYMHFSRLAA